MVALGPTRIEIEDNSNGASRWYAARIAPGDNGPYDGVAGDAYQFEVVSGITLGAGELAPTFGQITRSKVELRLPNGNQIGATDFDHSPWDNEPFAGTPERTVRLTSNPFAISAGDAARAGVFEIWLEIARESGLGQWGPVNSRTGGGNPAGSTIIDRQAGAFRGRLTLDAHSLSNVAQGGAEPSLWAFPDLVHWTVDTSATWLENGILNVNLLQGGTLKNSGGVSSNVASRGATAGRIEGDYAAGPNPASMRVLLPVNSIDGIRKFVWAAAGHEAGWTRVGDDTMEWVDRIDVDPTVTVDALTIDAPWDTATVHNRGDTVDGTLDRVNARGEAFVPVGSDRLRIVDVATDVVEQTLATPGRTGETLDWTLLFATAGNAAPADDVGAAKKLRYEDSGVNDQPPLTAEPTFGSLSSLYDVVTHLQLNNNVLDPELAVTSRLTADLGFYSVRLVSQRGEPINNAEVTDHLRDDGDLVTALDRTATTQAVNGHDGYLPLTAWEAGLPPGGWDHWVDAGSAFGNSYEKARLGAGDADYTLLANNPSFVAVVGGGPVTGEGEHFRVDGSVGFRAGASLLSVDTRKRVPVGTAKVALVRLQNAGANAGLGEYLDADGTTWVPLNDATGPADTDLVHFFDCAESRPNSDVFIRDFTPEQVAAWGSNLDIFVIARLTDNTGTPYGNYTQVPVVAGDVIHTRPPKPKLDAVGFALSGGKVQFR